MTDYADPTILADYTAAVLALYEAEPDTVMKAYAPRFDQSAAWETLTGEKRVRACAYLDLNSIDHDPCFPDLLAKAILGV